METQDTRQLPRRHKHTHTSWVSIVTTATLVCRGLIRPCRCLHTLLVCKPSVPLTSTDGEELTNPNTHPDDIIKSPRILDSAAEIQAVEGLSQCAIPVALETFDNHEGVKWVFMSTSDPDM